VTEAIAFFFFATPQLGAITFFVVTKPKKRKR
jgi:hypothetical protein